MNRRGFLATAGAAALGATLPVPDWGQASEPPIEHRLPPTDSDYQRSKSYIENVPVPQYHWASDAAVEAFKDMKFGFRIHWGIYSIWHLGHESWPFLPMSFEDREKYNHLYQTWNPSGFDAENWMNFCQECGFKMFAFTTKHHEGFTMFDTRARVRNRANWTAPGGPKIEDCNLPYSIMETPFRRDVVAELTAAARKRGIKIDLYFSHSDWYDADFRPYGWHPLQVPSSPKLWGWQPGKETKEEFWSNLKKRFAGRLVVVPDPTPEQVKRMVERHRTQLTELMTHYGKIDMLGLDIFWGPTVWPELRETILKVRQLQPDVMIRARGIGNYGDYYTPEDFVPSSRPTTEMPWFVIYPLGKPFSYDPVASDYKGAKWIIHNLVDVTAKGGNFMVGAGPDGEGNFHPTAVSQLKEAGRWLQVNGEGIYATRPRPASLWSDGKNLRFTRSKDNNTIYCFALEWPGRTLTVPTLKQDQVKSVKMLGYPAKLKYKWDGIRGLVIEIPEGLQQASNRPGDYAWGFKISRHS